MAQENEIDAMLDNLKVAKGESESAAQTQTASKPTGLQSDDALEVARAEVERLYDECDDLAGHMDRDTLHVGVSRNDGRNGVCKYETALTKYRFNKQITQTESKSGHWSIVVNEKILEQGNREEFLDTLRHEVAHALAYAKYDKYPSRKKYSDYDPHYKGHGDAWKAMASKLGADPSSCHSKRDRSDEYKYYIGCPNCGMESGRTKRCKVIKQPFTRRCTKCGHSPLSSYDAGEEPPEESGVVAVDSIEWDNREQYLSHRGR